MAQISYAGLFNGSALTVPDLYLNVQPGVGVIRAATFGLLALVGVASWGPVGFPQPLSAATLGVFGNPTVRTYDLGTAAAVALQAQQAAGTGANLAGVRVTDGTDLAASALLGAIVSAAAIHSGGGGTGYVVGDHITLVNGVVLAVATLSTTAVATVTVTTGIATSGGTTSVAQASTTGVGTGATFDLTETVGATLTSIYTGILGNKETWAIAPGSSSTIAVPTWRISLSVPGFATETFDNIAGTANAFWVSLAAAINNGNSTLRGPSVLAIASAGAGTTAPAAANGTMAGGTDGTATITSSVLLGSDTAGARKGMYAFRNSGASDLVIADLSDSTMEANIIAFAQSEGILCHVGGVAGETPSAAATTEQTAGIDNQWIKRYLGDWVYWNDTFNGQQRLLSPATFGASTMSTMPPQRSGLNKPVAGVVATQRSRSGTPYGTDELTILTQNSIEVIANPIPSGPVFGLRIGLAKSSNGSSNTDNWARLTSFIARSLTGPGALGTLIGQEVTPDFFTDGYALLDNFLSTLKSPKVGSQTIKNYQITFSAANNPDAQVAAGLVVAQVLIQYLGIARIFLVNLQSGATVVIPANNNAATTAQAA